MQQDNLHNNFTWPLRFRFKKKKNFSKRDEIFTCGLSHKNPSKKSWESKPKKKLSKTNLPPGGGG
jgi:hypothetical protein